MNDLISVALATYNGSKYLNEMLDSIEMQTYSHFIVHICDDGSSDNTIEIIKNHNLFKQGKIVLHEVSGGNGALKNFKRTIEHCPSGYTALCDQDDYWFPEKLSVMLNRIKLSENNHAGPKLIFSDLEIVDAQLSCIYQSFYDVSGKNCGCNHPKDFLISNHIPGCAMLFNRELKELIEPIPDNVRMHDWWIAIMAATFGEIIFESQSLIKYRQHGANTIGAQGMISQKLSVFQLIKNTRSIVKRSRQLQNNLLQVISNCGDGEKVNTNLSDDFVSLLESKMSLYQKLNYLKKMHSGENPILSFFAKWFI